MTWELRRVVLGAADPEAHEIEHVCAKAGLPVVYAAARGGRRVLATQAYEAIEPWPHRGDLWVEARLACWTASVRSLGVVLVDHHNPGDPGYDEPPERYLWGSSLGQVLLTLHHQGMSHRLGWDVVGKPSEARVLDFQADDECYRLGRMRVPEGVLLTAAADHCLGAAYAGRCPGVDPESLLIWRVTQRARHQRVSPDVLQLAVSAAKARLASAPRVETPGGLALADLRNEGFVRELPEAAARMGQPYVAWAPIDPSDQDRRKRLSLMGFGARPTDEAEVEALLTQARGGLLLDAAVDPSTVYGGPRRGFLGARVANPTPQEQP